MRLLPIVFYGLLWIAIVASYRTVAAMHAPELTTQGVADAWLWR